MTPAVSLQNRKYLSFGKVNTSGKTLSPRKQAPAFMVLCCRHSLQPRFGIQVTHRPNALYWVLRNLKNFDCSLNSSLPKCRRSHTCLFPQKTIRELKVASFGDSLEGKQQSDIQHFNRQKIIPDQGKFLPVVHSQWI